MRHQPEAQAKARGGLRLRFRLVSYYQLIRLYPCINAPVAIHLPPHNIATRFRDKRESGKTHLGFIPPRRATNGSGDFSEPVERTSSINALPNLPRPLVTITSSQLAAADSEIPGRSPTAAQFARWAGPRQKSAWPFNSRLNFCG